MDDLPTHWFGYQGADDRPALHQNPKFARLSLSEQGRRCGAGRVGRSRGGIWSCRSAAIPAHRRPDLEWLLPVTIERIRIAEGTAPQVLPSTARRERRPRDRDRRNPSRWRAQRRSRAHVSHVTELSRMTEATYPLIVQAPLGLGSVTVVAFDPDQPALLDWKAGRFLPRSPQISPRRAGGQRRRVPEAEQHPRPLPTTPLNARSELSRDPTWKTSRTCRRSPLAGSPCSSSSTSSSSVRWTTSFSKGGQTARN